MPVKKEVRDNILKALKTNPEGLTIQQIANSTKVSRITVTKYIHELLGANRIYEKRIGAYRLFFLRERFLAPVEDERIVKALKERAIRRMR